MFRSVAKIFCGCLTNHNRRVSVFGEGEVPAIVDLTAIRTHTEPTARMAKELVVIWMFTSSASCHAILLSLVDGFAFRNRDILSVPRLGSLIQLGVLRRIHSQGSAAHSLPHAKSDS